MLKILCLMLLLLPVPGLATYLEDFSAYGLGTLLTANPPNYQVVGGTWQVVAGLSGQAAGVPDTPDWAHAQYLGQSFSNPIYIRIRGKTSYWWGVNWNNELGFSYATGYRFQMTAGGGWSLQIPPGYPIYSGPENPADLNNFVVHISDVGGNIKASFDSGPVFLNIIDLSFTSGYFGFSTLYGTTDRWSDIRVSNTATDPMPYNPLQNVPQNQVYRIDGGISPRP